MLLRGAPCAPLVCSRELSLLLSPLTNPLALSREALSAAMEKGTGRGAGA